MENIVAPLKLAAKGRHVSPNFARISFVARIIQHESRDAPFAQMAYLCFLFALGVPSGDLPLKRDSPIDDLTAFSPMNDRALIALRAPHVSPASCLASTIAKEHS